MRSLPDETLQTLTSLTHSCACTTSNGYEFFHERKRFKVENTGRSSPRRQYDYTSPERTEHPQHMEERAKHVLSPSDGSQQYCQDGHALSQEQAQIPTNGVDEEQWDPSPGANSQGYESTTHDACGIVPKRKRKFCKRTKTGCITCRRKKKKCGEERPQCEYCTIASN